MTERNGRAQRSGRGSADTCGSDAKEYRVISGAATPVLGNNRVRSMFLKRMLLPHRENLFRDFYKCTVCVILITASASASKGFFLSGLFEKMYIKCDIFSEP